YLRHHLPAVTLGSLAPRLPAPGGDAYDGHVDDDPDCRGHPDRLTGAAGARALARRDPRGRLAVRHGSHVPALPRGVLASAVRLAPPGGPAQHVAAFYSALVRYHLAFHPSTGPGASAPPAAPIARVAGVNLGIP